MGYSANTLDPATVKSGSTAVATNIMMSTAMKKSLSPIIANLRRDSDYKGASIEMSYVSRGPKNTTNTPKGAVSLAMTEARNSNLGNTQRMSKSQAKGRKKRYNPNEDPNFNVNAP